MTPAALRDAIAAIGWTQTQLAAQAGCSSRLVRRWCAGSPRHAIPAEIETWVLALAAGHISHPVPHGWQTRPGVAR